MSTNWEKDDIIAQNGSGLIPETINLRQYWHIILERRWLVLATFVATIILCIIYIAKAPRIYQATTRLQINREADNTITIQDIYAMESREQDYLQTQYKNLTSRTLVEAVVRKLNLQNDERYAKSLDIVSAVTRDISVEPIRLSRLVDVKVQHTNPQQAANIASNLVHLFIEEHQDLKRLAYKKSLEWLTNEVNAQRIEVEKADRALQEYREKLNNISLEESQNIILQSLRSAQDELVKAKTTALVKQEIENEVQRLLKNGVNKESLPQVSNDKLIQDLKSTLALKEAELSNLLKRYKEKYPLVIQIKADIESLKKSINDRADEIIRSITAEAQLAKTQEETIAKYVKDLEKRQMALGKMQIEYDALRREATLKKEHHSRLLAKLQEMQAAANSKLNNLVVIDEAITPPKPIKPNITLAILLGIIGGIGAGCALAFFVNYLDDSIKTQDDVEYYLKQQFLGYIPNIKSNSVIERDLQAHIHPQSTAAEAFRTVRAAIALMPNAEKFKILTITSTIPGEGKSLVASNLAIVTAQTGLKTLLVDADLRRPSVHKTFQLHSPIGLSGFLSERVDDLEEILHKTDIPNLHIICAGAIPDTPSELISSKRMKLFLQQALKVYDRIFLDSPPVSAVSDPLMLAAVSDGVIFATKFNKIRREHARKSIQRLQDAGIRILGIVINDIDFEGKDSYYYSYYYQNRYYSSHYKSDKAKEESAIKS